MCEYNQKKLLNGFYFQWHITKTCNCRCEHCYQFDYSNNNELDFKQLVKTFLEIKKFIKYFYQNQLKKDKYIPTISLTGGEPFLRNDFLDLLKILSSNKDFFNFAILTNGTLITKEIATIIKKYGISFVQISIDGDEQTHDKIRGIGTFKKAIQGIKYLRDENINVSISFTANKLNFKSFPLVVKLGKDLGVNNVWTDRIIPINDNKQLINLSKEETKEYVNIINKERENNANENFTVSNYRPLQRIGTLYEKDLYSCHAGFNNFTILENGDIYPCRRMPVKLGNILSDSLIDIYINNDYMKKLRFEYEIPPEDCKNCKIFENCHGGSKCLSYAVYQNSNIKDPGCWLQ